MSGSTRVRNRQTSVAINVSSIILSLMVVVVVGFVWATGGADRDYTGEGNGDVVMVNVAAGESLSSLAEQLAGDGVVASTSAFSGAASGHPRANQLQPGWYRLEKRMSAEAAVNALLDPTRQAGTVDFPTGIRFEDTYVVGSDDVRKGIFTMISEASCTSEEDCITVEDLRSTAGTADLNALGVPEWAQGEVGARGDDPRRLEGLITPGIHSFDPSAEAVEILNSLVSDSAMQYEETGILQASERIGLSPYEIIVSASMIQMEAHQQDFAKVSRVILNRLEEPMRMQFDSTVNYDLEDQEVATTDEDRARETAWNTYAMDGLPATPIASPSIEAVQAMENPEEGAWLYFVTIDQEGTTIFTDNFDDHNAAIQQSIEGGVLDSNR